MRAAEDLRHAGAAARRGDTGLLEALRTCMISSGRRRCSTLRTADVRRQKPEPYQEAVKRAGHGGALAVRRSRCRLRALAQLDVLVKLELPGALRVKRAAQGTGRRVKAGQDGGEELLARLPLGRGAPSCMVAFKCRIATFIPTRMLSVSRLVPSLQGSSVTAVRSGRLDATRRGQFSNIRRGVRRGQLALPESSQASSQGAGFESYHERPSAGRVSPS